MSRLVRRLAGYALIYGCAGLDWLPWYDRRWYAHGQLGCRFGLATAGFKLQQEWTAVLVGLESGQEIQLGFVTFNTEDEAKQWCTRMNGPLPTQEGAGMWTRFEARRR